MPKLWPLLILLAVAGCSNNTGEAPATSKASREKRLEKSEVALSKTPVPRTYTIQGNQLQVLNIPVLNDSGFVEMQRCVVWRDAEFKTASISCPQQAEVLISGAQ